METVLLLIHLFLAVALVIVVLLQRSEGGALGIGGGTMGGLVSARSSANLMTKTTGIIAACFIASSLFLAILAGNTVGSEKSIIDPIGSKPTTSEANQPKVPVAN